MKYIFYIDMTTDEFLPYYRGEIHSVVATTVQGTRVQFPALHLRKHLTANGITGKFCLETENNKFSSLTKIA